MRIDANDLRLRLSAQGSASTYTKMIVEGAVGRRDTANGVSDSSIAAKGSAGSTGCHTGIRMKAYKDQVPVIVVGGLPGSFPGEYQAGGISIVLGLNANEAPVFHFLGTGIPGRPFHNVENCLPDPAQVVARRAAPKNLAAARPYMDAFSGYFGVNGIFDKIFCFLTPNTKIRTNSSTHMYSL